MGKIRAVLTVLMCYASINAFAQLKEVRGVQTKMVEYQSNEYKQRIGYDRHGFEFKNENNYTVWVEAELYTSGFVVPAMNNDRKYPEGVYDAKSFTLKAHEQYIWKVGDKMIKWGMGDIWDKSSYYYVRYKAYKAEE